MNEVIQSIITRRSVRSFQEKQISDEALNDILEAAKYAPSGMGKQDWHFLVVQNKEIIQKLAAAAKEVMMTFPIEHFKKIGSNPDYNPFYGAPTIIISAYEKESASGVSNCAAALENMFLAAHSMDIGSCWIHILAFAGNDEKVRSILTELGLPENYEISGTAAIGFNSKEAPKAAPRKEGTVTIVK
jgi:nitroreductase